MSGAWPPPAPSVWKVWIVLPAIALMVSSTKPASFKVSVWIHTCTSNLSATFRQEFIVEGVVPQSSWSFNPHAPASTWSIRLLSFVEFPFPKKPKFMGNASADWSILEIWKEPGVQVVAFVPVAGPVPPPNMVVIPEASAVSICWGQIKWIWVSIEPAVRICPSPAITSVDAPITISTLSWISGLPALPISKIIPSFIPTSALIIPHQSTIKALVITVSTAPSALLTWDCPIPSRITLPPPNLTSSPYVVKSFSTSIKSSVSASLTLSPVVGP